MNKRPYLIVSTLLGITFVLSIALGAVTIPPGNALSILISKIPGIELTGDWPGYFETILWDLRLPHTIT